MYPKFLSRLCHHSQKVIRAITHHRSSTDDWVERCNTFARDTGVLLLGSLIRLWARQCACIVAHRAKRECNSSGVSRVLLRRWVQSHTFFVAAVSCATCNFDFDWKEEHISDEVLFKHVGDIELVYELQEVTLACSQCGQQLRLSETVSSKTINRCQCSEAITSQSDASAWSPFIERKDVLVWRQEQQDEHSGLYAYKLYGRYDDVTAQDFLQVQMDTEYRREWDRSAVQLSVVDHEPHSGSEVIYWEMAWPRLFANRDYVFTRRAIVDPVRQRIIIFSRSTQHPKCPPRSGIHRVTHYWSVMVIKPFTDFDKPGIEFSLTYFDNPGLSIPAPVAAWVAISGLPNFLENLREAARKLRDRQLCPSPPSPRSTKPSIESSNATSTRSQQSSPRPTAVSVGWHSDSKLQ